MDIPLRGGILGIQGQISNIFIEVYRHVASGVWYRNHAKKESLLFIQVTKRIRNGNLRKEGNPSGESYQMISCPVPKFWVDREEQFAEAAVSL